MGRGEQYVSLDGERERDREERRRLCQQSMELETEVIEHKKGMDG